MDDHKPRTAATNKRAAAAMAATTPSPSRRRRRRLLTGSSPGCVPRPSGVASSSSASSSAATTPSRALRTPPPRRLLPPSSAGRLGGMAPPPRVPRSTATPLLRLDDVEIDEADMDGDGASTGDDAFSIISGDGSPERDRHVLDFLSFNALGDGTPAFTLFTPSPAGAKSSRVTRSIKQEIVTGLLTPQASPLRSQKDLSPSHFFRSPFAKSRSNSTTSSPAPLRLTGRAATENEDVDEREFETEPRQSVTRSPRTPQRSSRGDIDITIKPEPMPDAIVCKLAEGMRSSSSTPSSSSSVTWRRNSLSLMRTPSPASSAKAKRLRARAQIRRSTGRDPFEDVDEDLSSAPSALQNGNDKDWLFSFANTLSPLAPGTVNDDDLETSFLSLRFSPAVPSIDLQRLLPPFPSPGLGSREHTSLSSPTPMTPIQATGDASESSSSATVASSSGGSASSSSREVNESFPNIRASTSATPGRDERLKVSSSSVMKMKLHVTFDQFPPSHTKREIEAINNSLKRKKHARKRKLDESKHRSLKINSKGLNVQRKLLHTPVKEETSATVKSSMADETEDADTKPKAYKNRRALQSFNGRSAQRKLIVAAEDTKVTADKPQPSSSERSEGKPAGTAEETTVVEPARAAVETLRRRLSPTLGGVSTSTLPLSLTTAVQTPNLHPLKLRKSPLSVKPVPAPPNASKTIEKPVTAVSSATEEKPATAASRKPENLNVSEAPQVKAPVRVNPSTSVKKVSSATPVKVMKQEPSTTPVPSTKSASVASSQVLATPVQQPGPRDQSSVASQGARGSSKKVHCNCKKSKCLKLYCECFANGEYCDDLCNCVGCCNTPEHEDVRQQAITSRLEKNPNAFKPKIELTVVSMTPGVTPSRLIPGFTTPHNDHRHHHHAHIHGRGGGNGDLKKMHKHGCHCKKSGCQKRYCECFQAGVPCGENCRCIDCKNHSPHSVKSAVVTTPLSAISVRGPGARELSRGSISHPAGAATQDGEQFVSPSLQSVRERLRIDRETWARNFSSPFEVSPRRERERTERFRAQLKSSRASALIRSLSATRTTTSNAQQSLCPSDVVIKTEPGVVATTPSVLSFRVKTTPSFSSPSLQVVQGVAKPPRSLSPLNDATRPPPVPTPYGKDAPTRHTKRFTPYNPHALEALAVSRKAPGRVYVLPLFGDELPPVKTDVSAKIFHFLTNADVYNASLVNRLWSRVTMGETVWDHHNFRRMPRHLLDAVDAPHHADDGDVEMQT